MREVARRLSLPEPVCDAVFELRGSWLQMPPSSLLDTLLLANMYAEVPSPLGKRVRCRTTATARSTTWWTRSRCRRSSTRRPS
jgi:hypothetical protein